MGRLSIACLAFGLVALPTIQAGALEREGSSQWARWIEAAGIDPAAAIDPFSTSLEMVVWVDQVLQSHQAYDDLGQLIALQTALFDDSFGFRYEADLTLTATEAFEQRRGNCMSFTVLFVALARTAQIETYLMSVLREPEVELEGDLVVVNRHVVAALMSQVGKVTIFDFYLRDEGPRIQRKIINDVTATAMYHTNLGGDAIRDGRFDDASEHLRIATVLAPDWAPGWVNLGVVRNRMGDPDGAFEAYRKALEADPHDSSALTNIAAVYRSQGMAREADTALRAAAHQTTNPFTLIALADVETLSGRYRAARKWLNKAKRWYPKEPEVYRALSRLASERGDSDGSQRYKERAEKLERQTNE